MYRLSMLVIMLGAQPLMAADIAREIRTGDSGPDTSDGGYFEIGTAVQYFDGPRIENPDDEDNDSFGLGYGVSFEYRYHGLFAEAAYGSWDGINLGYSAWNNGVWTIDFLALSGAIFDGKKHDDISGLSEAERDYELLDRSFGFRGTGIRATAYWGDYIFQYRLLVDAIDNNGVVSSARVGRSWQVRNWNFHAIASVSYASAKANQLWMGVTPMEATPRFAAYTPGSNVAFAAELGVTYPINEHWVFRSIARYGLQSSESKGSPLNENQDPVFYNLAISYVF
jgi:MipA family protein